MISKDSARKSHRRTRDIGRLLRLRVVELLGGRRVEVLSVDDRRVDVKNSGNRHCDLVKVEREKGEIIDKSTKDKAIFNNKTNTFFEDRSQEVKNAKAASRCPTLE